MDVALRVAESVTMMHNGTVFKEGTPEEIENDAEVQELYLGDGHAERGRPSRDPRRLEIGGLNVYYGASHALQGVDLRLDGGVLSVVGRNGMGKTTLCKAIMGLVPVASGSITFAGQSLVGRARPRSRGWASATCRRGGGCGVADGGRAPEDGRHPGGAWTVERIYSTFPRLAERKSNGGAQLSGGEQQMLAISRALLANPRLLVMDEPTEGLAPVIVAQVEEMLLRLADEGDMEVLVIEQNIGVACAVADSVAIMVNGQINRIAPAANWPPTATCSNGCWAWGATPMTTRPIRPADRAPQAEAADAPVAAPTKIYMSNPTCRRAGRSRCRWRSWSGWRGCRPPAAATAPRRQAEIRPLAAPGQVVLVAGTLDTKGAELRYMRDLIRAAGLPVRMVDLSTSGGHSGAEIPAHQIAAFHPRGAPGVFTGDRGQSVAGMTLAFERWIARQEGIAGVLSAGGSGGTAMVAPGDACAAGGRAQADRLDRRLRRGAQYVGPRTSR
jgi:ABC-type branched-subunit amino acid transport system ATPase component